MLEEQKGYDTDRGGSVTHVLVSSVTIMKSWYNQLIKQKGLFGLTV